MSTNNKNATKSVRFDKAAKAGAEEENPVKKRSVNDRNSESDDEPSRKRGKRSRMDRPNQDEMDDVDDWVEDDDERVEGLPTEKQRLEAKRARREKRHNGDADDDSDGENGGGIESTKIDRNTSLASEGIAVEPFHMENEKSDGTGFFDGDTYVFRKRDSDDEPDAWLDGLKDTDKIENKGLNDGNDTGSADDDGSSDGEEENISKEQLYAKIIPLLSELSDKETIMQAVVRYGSLLKRQPLHRKKKTETSDSVDSVNASKAYQSESVEAAQKSLNDLTEAANALLNSGDVDIYQKTRKDLLVLIPEEEASTQKTSAEKQNDSSSPEVNWEYKGSLDGQIRE